MHQPVSFSDKICELRQVCTKKNFPSVHTQLADLVNRERARRMEGEPRDYVAVPVCHLPPGASPDEVGVFWAIYAPGPYTGLSGSVERRPVDLGMVVQHPPDDTLSPLSQLDVLPHGLCFMDQCDADSFATLMSLSAGINSASR